MTDWTSTPWRKEISEKYTLFRRWNIIADDCEEGTFVAEVLDYDNAARIVECVNAMAKDGPVATLIDSIIESYPRGQRQVPHSLLNVIKTVRELTGQEEDLCEICNGRGVYRHRSSEWAPDEWVECRDCNGTGKKKEAKECDG